MQKYIPSYTKKYDGKFKIVDDKLVYVGEDEKEIKWCEDLNILTGIPFDAEEWDKTATDESCFKWGSDTAGEDGYNVIIGYNASLQNYPKVRIPSRCKRIVCDGTYYESYYNVDDTGRLFLKNIEKIELPGTIAEIGENAFYTAYTVENITIPNSVTSIGRNAFSVCSGLKNIAIPDSVTNIGDWAFSGCSGLTNITIPDSVTSIGNGAFDDCSGLTNITIPDSVTSLGSDVFQYCSSLTNITIGDGVTSIGEYTFKDYSNLKNVTIGNGVTSIGRGAFYGCSSLTNVSIGNGVKNIGSCAFSGCSNLTNITIPDSVTSIGYCAFYDTAWYNNQPDGLIYINNVLYDYKGYRNMPANTEINVKDGTVSITAEALFACDNLKSITIPDSVVSIGYCAFEHCSNLTNITIGNGVKNIERDAFYDTAWYNNQPDGVIYISKVLYDYKGYRNMPANTKINVKDGTVSISENAFQNCSNLTNITMPNSVTSIGSWAFSDCSNLTNIQFLGTMNEWNNILKDSYWSSSSSIKTITCTDGTITL